jgi:DNA-binding response OmpR family regulator
MSSLVLVIEKNELLVEMYRTIFRAIHCELEHAASIDDALRRLPAMRVALVVLDDRLAQGVCEPASHFLFSQLAANDTPLISTITKKKQVDPHTRSELCYGSLVSRPFQVSEFSALAQRTMRREPALVRAH